MNTNIIDLEDYLENREAMPDIQSIAGERWFPEETNITEDMTKYWGATSVSARNATSCARFFCTVPEKKWIILTPMWCASVHPSILKSSESSMMCLPTTIAATGSRCSM